MWFTIYFRNCVEATPKEMAIRRGVSNHVIQLYEKYENGDQSEERHSRTLFHEFSDEMGKNNMILLILILIFVSLYVAYTISGLSGQRGQAIIL